MTYRKMALRRVIYKKLINSLRENKYRIFFSIKPSGTNSSHITLRMQITGKSRIANSCIPPAVHKY